MAHKLRITEQMLKTNPNLNRVPHLYQIESAVGSGCPNKRDDVMLIQFMLYTWVKTDFSRLTDSLVPKASLLGDVPLHGTVDIPTLGFLIVFQLHETNRLRGPATGRIDPMGLMNLQRSGDWLAALNAAILAYKPDVFRDFSVAPALPGALMPLLKSFR